METFSLHCLNTIQIFVMETVRTTVICLRCSTPMPYPAIMNPDGMRKYVKVLGSCYLSQMMLLIISYHFNSSVIITKCYAVFVDPPAEANQYDSTQHNNNEPAADSQGQVDSPAVKNSEQGECMFFLHLVNFLDTSPCY